MRPCSRWGLRARLIASFTLGALLLSAALAAASFHATRNYLLSQREASAASRTIAQGQTLADGLRSPGVEPGVEPGDLLTGLRAAPDARLLLHLSGRWYGAEVAEVLPLPADIVDEVGSGRAVRQRIRLAGEPQLVVGVPLTGRDAQLFEVFSLVELDRTLRRTSRALVLIALVTALAGAVGGWATSRRLLRPLDDVLHTSRSIAGGRLEARLRPTRDPDVAPLVASFNAMTAALQERIDRDARFAADVSHELRSPLTTLTTALSVLHRRRGELSERSRAAVDLLTVEVERFEKLVQDLLEISRLDAGPPFERQPVRLARLVLHSPSLARHPQTPVEINADAALVAVLADKRRLERVLANLLDNAARYGGGATAVHVVRHGAERVRLLVDDSGPGVRLEDRGRIFDRFSRGSSGERDGRHGVGLGLALASDQVASHGGRIWVEDRPGGGARFIVDLPIASSAGEAGAGADTVTHEGHKDRNVPIRPEQRA